MGLSKRDYKYQRLVNTLEREIHLNYAPGERFPPELNLCEQFKLNRRTVHRAITLLAKKGLLVQKGRGGIYVPDFDEVGFDNRLVCAAMGLRSHLWDRLFLSLSYHAGLNEKFLLAVDLAGHKSGEWESKRLSDSESFRRVKHCLSWHPRSLIADFDFQQCLPSSEMSAGTFEMSCWWRTITSFPISRTLPALYPIVMLHSA